MLQRKEGWLKMKTSVENMLVSYKTMNLTFETMPEKLFCCVSMFCKLIAWLGRSGVKPKANNKSNKASLRVVSCCCSNTLTTAP